MSTDGISTILARAPSPDSVLQSIEYLSGKLTRAARQLDRIQKLDTGKLASRQFILNASMSLAALIKGNVVVRDSAMDTWMRERGCPLVAGFIFVSIPPPNHAALRKMELYLVNDSIVSRVHVRSYLLALPRQTNSTHSSPSSNRRNPFDSTRVSIHLDDLPLSRPDIGTSTIHLDGKPVEVLKLPLIFFVLADTVMRGDGVHHWYRVWTMAVAYQYWTSVIAEEVDRQAQWENAIRAVDSERLQCFLREAQKHFGDSTVSEQLVSKVVERLHEASTGYVEQVWEMIEQACIAVHTFAGLVSLPSSLRRERMAADSLSSPASSCMLLNLDLP
ncbi:hypothetical protein JCM5353_008623 [Sporobolomyces roseus]